MRACVYIHGHFYSARVSSRKVMAEAEDGGERRKERETSMLEPCDRHGDGEWSWGLRLSEYTADEREKKRKK